MLNRHQFFICVLTLFLTVNGCSSKEADGHAPSPQSPGSPSPQCQAGEKKLERSDRLPFDLSVPQNNHEIKIMGYNVENLFDTVHEPGKNDYEFLPAQDPDKAGCLQNQNAAAKEACLKINWTPSHLAIKLQQIRKVIDAQGSRPDLLSIEEIESDAVAKQLAETLGYEKYLITHGQDERGINVALLFNEDRLIYIDHVEVPVTYSNPDPKLRPTRPILSVHFRLKDERASRSEILGVYVNHWPSQSNPSEFRVDAAEALKNAVDRDTEKFGSENYHVIALGDFNTIPNDDPHPFATVIQNRTWKNALSDVQTLFERVFSKTDKERIANRMPKGSYFFAPDMTWNHLDVFFVSPNLLDQKGLDAQISSFRIVAPEFASTTYEYSDPRDFLYGSRVYGVPHGYNHSADSAETAGYSDHFPVVLKVSF